MQINNSKKQFYLVRDIIDEDEPPEHAIILRLDVERAVNHHQKQATILAENSIFCSMYFHTRHNTYNLRTMKCLEEQGHEIGYHHECLDRCEGNFARARELFLREVEKFRKDGFDLKTVCEHGEVGLKKRGYTCNRNLFDKYPGLLQQAGVKEVYHWLSNSNSLCAIDTFKRYRDFWKTIDKAKTTSAPMMIVAHLHRWRKTIPGTFIEIGTDFSRFIINKTFKYRIK